MHEIFGSTNVLHCSLRYRCKPDGALQSVTHSHEHNEQNSSTSNDCITGKIRKFLALHGVATILAYLIDVLTACMLTDPA